jgi:hypothetical protein
MIGFNAACCVKSCIPNTLNFDSENKMNALNKRIARGALKKFSSLMDNEKIPEVKMRQTLPEQIALAANFSMDVMAHGKDVAKKNLMRCLEDFVEADRLSEYIWKISEIIVLLETVSQENVSVPDIETLHSRLLMGILKYYHELDSLSLIGQYVSNPDKMEQMDLDMERDPSPILCYLRKNKSRLFRK